MTTALELTKLKIRMLLAIEADRRARKGSDKTYMRECRCELKEVRGLITKLLNEEEE